MDSDLTTVAVAADSLGVSDPADAKVARAVSAASSAIARYINRPRLHYTVGFVEKLRGHIEQTRLQLGLLPVSSVASVVFADGTSLAASDYVVEDLEQGWLYRSIWPYTGLVRSGLLYDTPAVGTERASIVVTYTGGWVTPAQAVSVGWPGPARNLPSDVEEACLQTVAAIYQGSGRDGAVASESFGDYSVAYRASLLGGGVIPDSAMPLIAAYRRLM